MAQNNLFDQDDLKILNEDNTINNEKFKEFHRKVFQEMMEQSLFLACDFLKKSRERPGVGDFEKKISDLTSEIMKKKKKKIDLLGDYLKK